MNQPVINIKNVTINLQPSDSALPLNALLAASVAKSFASGGFTPSTASNGAAVTERFELSADGLTITDHKTGLMWDAEEREFPNADAAEAHVREMALNGYGGYRDWIVPSDMTLQTIVDRSLREPACAAIFKSKGRWVITSTPYKADKNKPAGSSGLVWIVNFCHGLVHDNDRSLRCFVRAVRSVSPAGQ